ADHRGDHAAADVHRHLHRRPHPFRPERCGVSPRRCDRAGGERRRPHDKVNPLLFGKAPMTFVRLLAPLALLAAPLDAALAHEWPAHPLRIIVPFPAGGSADAQTRVIADELSRTLGQPVIVENKPGAGGNLGAAAAAHAAPDGYTLFMATTGTHASNISLYK